MNEIWKDIEGYEGHYLVSNLGRVKSIKIWDGDNKSRRILAGYKDKDGYLRVNLHKNGRRGNESIHRLVAKTFIANPENKPQVNHKNGIKEFNWAINLEWVTPKENIRHAVNSGLRKTFGSNNASSKLTENDVRRIIENKNNLTHDELAALYGVSQTHITNIINRKVWKHIEMGIGL